MPGGRARSSKWFQVRCARSNSPEGVSGPEAVPGARRAFQVVPGSSKALRAFQEPGGRGELTRERFEGTDGLLGDGKRVSLAGEDAGEDGL